MKNSLIGFFLSLFILTGCGSMDQASRTVVGSQIGSLAGGIVGAVIGNNSDRWDGAELGAMIGSFAGGAAGAVIGANMDNKKAKAIEEYNRNLIIEVDPEAPVLDIEDVYLEDQNNNQMIDAGESCRLTFIIVNNGKRDAINVLPVIEFENNPSYFKLSDPVIIQSISPDDKVSYSVKVKASSKLQNGKSTVAIRLQEYDGFDMEKQTFPIATKRR